MVACLGLSQPYMLLRAVCWHLQLAWRPCQLDVIVRSAVPFVLEPDWQPCGDKEMLVLQVS